MKFSQRIGKTPIKNVLQVESIDEDLKNRLWNLILEGFFDRFRDYAVNSKVEKAELMKLIWKEFFKQPIDTIPSFSNTNGVYVPGTIEYIRNWFYGCEWFEIYDFLEFISLVDIKTKNLDFEKGCNYALKKEVAGYRIVNQHVVQITADEEILEIEEAITYTDKWKSVSTHIKTALDNLADRKNPNYRNSVKESISAVESFCKIITNDDKATLGKALNEIEKTHNIHGALKSAFSSIYGYTSDSGGIRHALLEKDVIVNFEDAKFMLVSCSAFINYLRTKTKI